MLGTLGPAAALAFVDGPERVTEYPKLDCSRVHGAVQELLGSRQFWADNSRSRGFACVQPPEKALSAARAQFLIR